MHGNLNVKKVITVLVLFQLTAAAVTDTNLVNVTLSHHAPSVGSNFRKRWTTTSGFVASSRLQVN